MDLCAICGKNPAVVYITKIENGKTSNQGICLSCASKMGIKPINDMIQGMGLSEDDIDSFNSDMSSFAENMGNISSPEDMRQMFENMSGGDPDEGGAATAPFNMLSNLFEKLAQNSADNNGGEGLPAVSDNGGGKPADDGKDKKQEYWSSSGDSRKGRFSKGKKSMLDTYGTDLTRNAAEGKVDKVVNRDAEINRVIQILNRRNKNNPVLLGEPGVGKTAIAEGLAVKIVNNDVPPKLINHHLILVDFAAMVAGTQFRGQFEARLKTLLDEAARLGNVILVIDEIHNIVAAGDAEGAMSAANILKPALARGEIRIIGATTLSEYRKFIEKDTALERRFQPVTVDEPSVAESIEILKQIKGYYESYHHVKISDDIIEQAVRMSERYITERFLPDKAIDLIDEAGSAANLRNVHLDNIRQINEQLKVMREGLDALNENGDYENAAKVRTDILNEESRLREEEALADRSEITFDDIAAVVEGWTKIPVHRLTESETHRLLNLESRIHERVIGQDEAVNAVARAIRRGRADINVKKRPVSFIFAGSTGVGKTELVKTIAEVMFDSEDALIRLDMSEYMEKHSVSKLIGSPPGYVGYDDAGQLTEKIRRKPYSVILLDEIEKADPEVFNLFLQILDDGRVADSHGKIINFENTIIVMTTNAGSEFRASAPGFTSSDELQMEDNVDKSLKSIFRPEFLNRIDEVVTFKMLTKDELKQIIDLLLKDITDKLKEKNVSLSVTDSAKNIILEEGYDVKYGARPLKRAIQRLIEDKLARLSLEGAIPEGTCIAADAENGEIVFNILKP